MDIKDISDVENVASLLRKATEAEERAGRRRGEVPHDHPPVEKLVAKFMLSRLFRSAMSPFGGSEKNSLFTTLVPPAYPPCTRPSESLQPVPISRMRLEIHHRGKKVTVRTLTPPARMNSIMAIVEDEEGTAVLLQLYNQPEEMMVEACDMLPENSVCVVKEPFFKVTSDGSYSLRVDHVGDVLVLPSHDDRIPKKWRSQKNSFETSQQIRLQGNEAVREEEWGKAERLYSDALLHATTSEDKQAALLNRSLANLRLQRPEKALQDALRARGDGEYEWKRMLRQANETPPVIDCATYSSPVEVRDSPGRGKGLFTTKAVKAGDLLLCEKAFSYCFAEEDDPMCRSNFKVLMNMGSKKITVGGQASLIALTVQNLFHNPKMASSFTELHHGNYQTVQSIHKEEHWVDAFLVERIISLNCFGAPRTSLETITQVDTRQRGNHTTCGIWIIASRINHSCLFNCERSFIGDMMIVRAAKDLDVGTELFFCYQLPEPGDDYQSIQDRLQHWGFTCQCDLCREKKSTPKHLLQRRKSLLWDLRMVMRTCDTLAQETKAQQILAQLEACYPGKGRAPRLELCDPYLCLAHKKLEEEKFAEALELTIKSFEALGYVIVASPPAKVCGKSELQVVEWGRIVDPAAIAFLGMSRAYRALAPELCESAERYAAIAHAVCFGETDMFRDRFAVRDVF